MREFLKRLADIANQLDESGLPEEADAIDNVVENLAPAPDQPSPVVQEAPEVPDTAPESPDVDPSLEKPITDLVDSIVGRMTSSGMSLEEVMSPEGQHMVAQEVASAVQQAGVEATKADA